MYIKIYRLSINNHQRKEIMDKRKIGLIVLAAGAVILLVALLLLFNTNSPWALITLGLSIIVNTTGLSILIAKRSD